MTKVDYSLSKSELQADLNGHGSNVLRASERSRKVKTLSQSDYRSNRDRNKECLSCLWSSSPLFSKDGVIGPLSYWGSKT